MKQSSKETVDPKLGYVIRNKCKYLRRSDWQCLLMKKRWLCPVDDDENPKKLCNWCEVDK